jgi:Outer membrane protein beta-barrel domain
MNFTKVVALIAVVMIGLTAWAQDYPKIQVYGDYSLVHFNPSKRFTSSHNLNGGGGGVVYNFTHMLGIKMDLQGYGSQTDAFVIPAGSRLGNITTASPISVNVNGNLFTYLFGPQIQKHGRFAPFGEVLIGGAHSNLYGNAFKVVGATVAGIGAAPSNNGFALLAGGGIDIKLTHAIAVRPGEFDYLLTRFGNAFTGAGSQNQNNFRYSAGIVFQFGGK